MSVPSSRCELLALPAKTLLNSILTRMPIDTIPVLVLFLCARDRSMVTWQSSIEALTENGQALYKMTVMQRTTVVEVTMRWSKLGLLPTPTQEPAALSVASAVASVMSKLEATINRCTIGIIRRVNHQ